MFISLCDEFEEDAGLRLVLPHVAEIIEHQAVDAVKLCQKGWESEIASGSLEALYEIVGTDEHRGVSSLDHAVGDCGGDVALSCPATAEEQAVAMGLHPVAGAQRLDTLTGETWHKAKLEAIKALAWRQLGKPQQGREAAIATLSQFELAEGRQEAFKRPGVLGGLRGEILPGTGHGGQPQGFERLGVGVRG